MRGWCWSVVEAWLAVAVLVVLSASTAFARQADERLALALGESGVDALGRPSWSISADGRFVVFTTRAALVAEDRNGLRDVYVLDRRTGRLSLESPGAAGVPADGDSTTPDISGDGRLMVFISYARNLTAVRQDEGVPRVHLRDRHRGHTEVVAARGGNPAISDDGRVVVFESGTTCGAVSDAPPAPPQLCLVRITPGGWSSEPLTGRGPAGGQLVSPALDATGTRVVFVATADLAALPEGRDTNGASDVYLWDTAAGRVTLVSHGAGADAANGRSYHPAISADGRYVAFVSDATDLVGAARSSHAQVYLFDSVTRRTVLISRNAAGRPGNGASLRPAVGRDGRRIAYQSLASDLVHCPACAPVAADVNLLWDVYLHDVATGATWPAMRDVDPVSGSHGVVIDAAGTLVAFGSRQPRDATDNAADVDLFVGPWPSPDGRRHGPP